MLRLPAHACATDADGYLKHVACRWAAGVTWPRLALPTWGRRPLPVLRLVDACSSHPTDGVATTHLSACTRTCIMVRGFCT